MKIQVCGSRIIPRALRFGIQPDHAGFIQRSLELSQRSNCWSWQRKPIQEHCVIAWEKLQIVFKRDQIVFANLCVGRVSVFHINRPILQRRVAERVINPDYVLLWKDVTCAQWLPSILSIQKFVGESDLQFGMISQIADCVQAESLRFTATHDERVSVIEAERFRHAHPKLRERLANFVQR